jgi:hypothetical protein
VGRSLGRSHLDCDTEWLDSDARKAATATYPADHSEADRQMVPSASAQGAPIYQVTCSPHGERWQDVAEDEYNRTGKIHRRIVYAAPAPVAPPAALTFDEWYARAKDGMRHWVTFNKCEAAWNAALLTASPAALTVEQVELFAAQMVKRGSLNWAGFREDADGRYTIPVVSKSVYDLIRALLAASLADHSGDSADMVAQGADFDAWMQNPYTKVLQKSIADDYVPKTDTSR